MPLSLIQCTGLKGPTERVQGPLLTIKQYESWTFVFFRVGRMLFFLLNMIYYPCCFKDDDLQRITLHIILLLWLEWKRLLGHLWWEKQNISLKVKTSSALTVYFDLYIFKDMCRNLSFKTPTHINGSETKLQCMTLKI